MPDVIKFEKNAKRMDRIERKVITSAELLERTAYAAGAVRVPGRDRWGVPIMPPGHRPATEEEAQRGLNDTWPGDAVPLSPQTKQEDVE